MRTLSDALRTGNRSAIIDAYASAVECDPVEFEDLCEVWDNALQDAEYRLMSDGMPDGIIDHDDVLSGAL